MPTCEKGTEIMERMERTLGDQMYVPVTDIQPATLRDVAKQLAEEWATHFESCSSCGQVWLDMGAQALRGQAVNWKTALGSNRARRRASSRNRRGR